MTPFSPFIRFLLLPFAFLYGLIIQWRNSRYDRGKEDIFQADVPVVSVGNLSVGGTGKTPFSEYLLHFFSQRGIRVAYLSRGYGRKTRGYYKVPPSDGLAHIYGDEALQVACKFPALPVAVCEDRQMGIRRLTSEEGAQLIVLDDAFQHRKVARDLDLLLIDANRMPTADRLLPAGRLREPLASLHRSDMLIVNKLTDPALLTSLGSELEHFGKKIAFCRPVFDGLKHFDSELDVGLQPQSHRLGAVVFSGLGNNHFFQEQVKEWGIQAVQSLSFADHHRYTRKDISKITQAYLKHSEKSAKFDSFLILTTEKDYFRLKGLEVLQERSDLPWVYVPIKLAFWQGQEVLEEKLQTLCAGM